MKKLELRVMDLSKTETYTYNCFSNDISNYDDFIDYLIEKYNNFDFEKTDKYINYIYSIIDNSDSLFINELEKSKELNIYINNLKYKYYDRIKLVGGSDNRFSTRYLFDIRDAQSKQFVKENLKFNLSDEYREPMIIKTDRKYILNDDDREYSIYDEGINLGYAYCDYCFVKGDCLQLILYQRDGYIDDYRDIDELYFLKRKYLKVKNKNYNTYDYTKFSNDIDDDKYINYIYDIIDNSNYMFARCLPFEEKKCCQENLNFIYYDKILLEDKSKDFEVNYIFEIKDRKAKDFIKEKIKFNLSNKDKEPILVNSNKKYILNEIGRKEYEYVNYGFIKDDYLEVLLHQENGYIDDYRPTSLIEKSLNKYKG